MRYSTLQEQTYGVALPQDRRLSTEMNETVMANTDTMELKNNSPLEEGSVVSNLPLLFANGHPTSLEKITLAQLERFISFMVECSLGHDTSDVISEPRWWPKEVKFSNPLTRPKRVNENWIANLKKLVFRCYTYHRSEYLLRFCSYLARYPQEDLEYVNNWDSTTSLYHKNTGKLLVTFRNENMNYDKRYENPRKKLLSCNGGISPYSVKLKQQQHSIMMVEPPTEDIYLCDNCDAEFIGLEKMKEHESVCCEKEQKRSNLRSETPDLPSAEPELKQDQFLEYFRLCSANLGSKSVEPTSNSTVKNCIVERTSRRVRGSINFTRCSSIPFSSPAGLLLAKKSKAMTEETQHERLERIERHLIAPVLNSSSKPKWLEAEYDHDRWIVTYKSNREKSANDYVHQYQFVNSVRQKPMLSIQSQLLYVVCRPVYVLLTRVTQEQIDNLRRYPSRYRCLARNVSADSKETMTELQERARPNVSSKRKAPSDESETDTMKGQEEVVNNEVNITTLTVSEGKNTYDKNNTTVVKSIKESTLPTTKSSNEITVIDLCSSDEEENPCTSASSNENTNPMKCRIKDNTTKSLQNHSSPELHFEPRICSTKQNSEWLSDNILNNDSESYMQKYYNKYPYNFIPNP